MFKSKRRAIYTRVRAMQEVFGLMRQNDLKKVSKRFRPGTRWLSHASAALSQSGAEEDVHDVVQDADLEDPEQLRPRVGAGERHVTVVGRDPGDEWQDPVPARLVVPRPCTAPTAGRRRPQGAGDRNPRQAHRACAHPGRASAQWVAYSAAASRMHRRRARARPAGWPRLGAGPSHQGAGACGESSAAASKSR